jgi:xanthine/CO dehydrogenase XdhC/CoxF family maturation factor
MIIQRATVERPGATRRPEVRLDTSLELLLERLDSDAAPRVLATVVATAGSTYRKPGARMLIMADGSCVGLLSGGCLEADLGIHAQQVLESGVPRAVEYDMRGPDDILFGIGAGCEGAMRVLLEPAGPGSLAAAALMSAGRATRDGMSTSLVAVHDSVDLALGTYSAAPPLPAPLIAAALQALDDAASREFNLDAPGHAVPARRLQAFIQFLAPPPHLLLCGAGPDAEPVVSIAQTLGWRVTAVDHRPAYVSALAARFPRAEVRLSEARLLRSIVDLDACHAAVVMSHHLPSDLAYLRELAEAGAPAYVGLLGPLSRRHRLASELGHAADKLQSRIRGPVGIDLGAVTPEAIALAIVSQIHAWLAGRPAAVTAQPLHRAPVRATPD